MVRGLLSGDIQQKGLEDKVMQIDLNIIWGFLGGIVTAISLVKGIDWMISTKYVSKTDCEKCRSEIYERANGSRDLLVKINTKVDLLMANFDLTEKE